ncbi:pentapeptide repeat-containing protein [Sphingomonas sp. BN140010]|uniref:Pentapeptide repeat-containing protein n=1 Tax=Sphingomonas arvum TaxID=2992113 RepID=A0ABT3JED2_9SPHN|nr:pentapeptide repeat-containing protein [Sphingomonas sp. BN140010]MCW3797401.1 pentapeptide repeat-containing protein [Sphingomonas sp. BN140010]
MVVQRTDSLRVAPLRTGDRQLEISFAKAAKALAGIAAVCIGPTGIPTAISNLPDALGAVSFDFPPAKKAQGQGFTLYVTALVAAMSRLLVEHAPSLLATKEGRERLAELVLSSLQREELTVNGRFFTTPALNPGFVRVREAFVQMLENLASDLPEGTPDAIGSRLGNEFAQALSLIVQSAKGKQEFAEFLDYYKENPFSVPASRGWLWDDYRSAINRQIYSRLFLHEMEDHPDVGLADLYVPSRAIYRTHDFETKDDPNKKVELHAVDLATFLKTSWLSIPASKGGLSRLLTGDPGCGKSTFSMMFAQHLLAEGWRVVVIQANSIRSLGLSLKDILSTHLMRVLKLEAAPNIDAELCDPEATGRPLLIVLDGLDEYDIAGMTVSMSAARLAEHAIQVTEEWSGHDYNVRLLLCGRPEAAAGLTARFRDRGHHLHVTGFLSDAPNSREKFADQTSEKLLSIDQRQDWWTKWQRAKGERETGIPDAIQGSKDVSVKEITSQPLLNYMLAVLKLYDQGSLTNLSALYGTLFARYYDRQAKGKSKTFEALCPSLDRFRRIMSEIGIAAWHAGDRSVSVDDLRSRFDRPPLKHYFEQADRTHNSGMGAILSAFYTRPEDAASPDSGLAERYVFTHKSFREYLTAVAISRFLERLRDYMSPEAEDGWSDTRALSEWLELFGPTPMDHRQWEFLQTELEVAFADREDLALGVKRTVERIFELVLSRQMPLPAEASNFSDALQKCGNAEEAALVVLSAIRVALLKKSFVDESDDWKVKLTWASLGQDEATERFPTHLREFMHRIRSRPGVPEGLVMSHLYCLFELGGPDVSRQIESRIIDRGDGWTYASFFDFSGSNIVNARLDGASLHYGRFHRAEISGASFIETDLSGSDLSYSSTSRNRWFDGHLPARFDGASLSSAFMFGANLRYANFNEANMSFAYVYEAETAEGALDNIRLDRDANRNPPRGLVLTADSPQPAARRRGKRKITSDERVPLQDEGNEEEV